MVDLSPQPGYSVLIISSRYANAQTLSWVLPYTSGCVSLEFVPMHNYRVQVHVVAD